jgi:hypothetical protein
MTSLEAKASRIVFTVIAIASVAIGLLGCEKQSKTNVLATPDVPTTVVPDKSDFGLQCVETSQGPDGSIKTIPSTDCSGAGNYPGFTLDNNGRFVPIKPGN